MIVVSDTSVLLNLAAIGEDHLLQQLFGQVVAPSIVQREFLNLSTFESRFRKAAWPSWVVVCEPRHTPLLISKTGGILDPGETEAIALALELKADIILMDEEAGRAAAKSMGLSVTGIAGILLRAKASGFVTKVSPILDRLSAEAGFWLGESLRKQILNLAGESS